MPSFPAHRAVTEQAGCALSRYSALFAAAQADHPQIGGDAYFRRVVTGCCIRGLVARGRPVTDILSELGFEDALR